MDNHFRIKPKISTIFLVVLLYIFLFAQGTVKKEQTYLYIIFFMFFMLISSYFTNYISKNSNTQNNLYFMFTFFGFPVFSSYIVFFESFHTESIFLFFILMIIYIFYCDYENYIKKSFLGILIGFIIYILSNDLNFPKAKENEFVCYFLFILSIFVSFFISRIIYSQIIQFLAFKEEKMEQSIAMIIHDLSNPLSHIKICTNNIINNKDEKSIEKNIEKIVKRVNQLLQEILNQKNNLSNNIPSPNLEPIDMIDFITSFREEFCSINMYPIQINISGENFKIQADKYYLDSIFYNLFHNAFFFIKKAKKGCIDIHLECLARKNRIIFKDTGYGIPSEILPHIFEKGFSARQNGTGMGLYLCKLMIKSLKGTIDCQSVFGHHTSFIITFPK